jgi:hypothetical protein
MCGYTIIHLVQFSGDDQWHVSQEMMLIVFQERLKFQPVSLGSE